MNKLRWIWLFTIFVVIMIPAEILGQENYSTWKYYARIYLNTTSSGVAISTGKSNFPLLIRLNNSNFPLFDSVKTQGADVRFSNSAGVHLAYEIERWINNNGLNDTAEIWVKIDSISTNDNSQYFVMHWGNNSAVDSSNGSKVFSNGFEGVYHLAEKDMSGAGTVNYYKDVSGKNHHGIDSISSNTDNGGYIGYGHKFGKKDVIPLGTWNPSTSRITLSAWVKWDGAASASRWASIISKTNSINPEQMYWQLLYSPEVIPPSIAFWDGTVDGDFATDMISSDSWHYITLVSRNGVTNGTLLYIDGVSAGISITSTWGTLSTAALRIGNDETIALGNGDGYYWPGYLDEIRIENTANSADWTRLCYENQKARGQKLVTIRFPIVITKQPLNDSVITGDTASFSISAEGSVVNWQWYRSSDGQNWSIPAGLTTTPVYKLKTSQSDTNTFFRCVVSNAYENVISTNAKLTVCAPVVITKQPANALGCVPGQQVTFTIAADGQYLKYQWEKATDGVNWGSIAGATTTDFSFVAKDGDPDAQLRCGVSSPCEIVYSNVALYSVSKLSDTLPPVNKLYVSGLYTPLDTVTFVIDSIQTIEWSKVDSVEVWFGIGIDSIPDFSNRTNVITWNYQEFMSGMANGKFYFKSVDKRFDVESTKLYVGVILYGKNQRKSSIRISSFIIGRLRPENPVILQARTINSNSILLSWNKLSNIEKLRILYKTGSPVPYEYEFSGLDSVIVLVDSISKVISSLNPKTRYYFAAQIYRDGMWSRVTSASSASDSTLAAGTVTIKNTIKIQQALFDSSKNQIMVAWTVNTDDISGLQIGISYTTANNKAGDSAVFQIVNVSQQNDKAFVVFREAIEFEHDYTILLRLRKTDEDWTAVTDDSRAIVHIPSFTWQNVVINFKQTPDTTLWVNKTIRIITPPVNLSEQKTINGTIAAFVPDNTLLTGFIKIGNGFKFIGIELQDSLSIGITCPVIPAGYSINDVRMYRFDGAYFLVESKVEFDSSGHFVSIKTNNFSLPFIALIDTLRPVITAITDRDSIISMNTEYRDTLIIRDNTGNIKWYFKCSKGSDPFSSGFNSTEFTLKDGTDTIIVSTLQQFTGGNDGVRSMVFVSDGRTTSVLNTSRRIKLPQSSVITTVPMKWVPLKIAASLDTPTVAHALQQVIFKDGKFVYDDQYVRLFRWYPALAQDRTIKWIEFSPGIEQVFKFTSGQLFWVKTREQSTVNFGSGVTMSLRDTFKIKLDPVNWTDFAVPYQFDVKIGDILAASQKESPRIGDVQFYQWKKDSISGQYSTDAFFISALGNPLFSDPARSMGSNANVAFTAWNPTTDTITLCFPPLPASASSTVCFQKMASNGCLLKLVVKLEDGHTIRPVYCGLGESIESQSNFPIPPSFEQINVGIVSDSTRTLHACMVANNKDGDGNTFIIAYVNTSSKSEQIRCTFESLGNLDPNAKVALLHAESNTLRFLHRDEPNIVTLQANSTIYGKLLVGNEKYINNSYKIFSQSKLGLSNIYPNPIRGCVNIRYSIPFSTVDNVELVIMSISGKAIWKTVESDLVMVNGSRNVLWNTVNSAGDKIGSGIYIVKMSAYNKSKLVGMFNRRITVLP